MTTLCSCPKEGHTSYQTTIALNTQNPLTLAVNTEQPKLTGTMHNDGGLQSYSTYYIDNTGVRTAIAENNQLHAVSSHDFTIDIPVPENTEVGDAGSVQIKVSAVSEETIATKTIGIKYIDSEEETGETSPKLAFPGADGYGKYTTGGRGGKVLIVNSLADDGSVGTLRWAVNQLGKRTVVFRVAGYIDLQSNLNIRHGDITIAGQTAPGDGICLRGATVFIGADNVIIRYIRSRPGQSAGDGIDAMWGRNQKDIIIDHCSLTWSTDECASFYANENFTMQYCLVGQSLYDGGHSKGNHGFGGIWGGTKATFHHNLIVSNDSRNPRLDGNRSGTGFNGRDLLDLVNNVIFNWGGNSCYGGEGSDYNIMNNYYKAGPATPSKKAKRIIQITDPNSDPSTAEGKYYVYGNYVSASTSVSADNSQGVDTHRDYDKAKLLVSSPVAELSIAVETAEQAYAQVLKSAGASLSRDAVDTEIINFVTTGETSLGDSYGACKGIIDHTTIQTNGYPALQAGVTVTDLDEDGMADEWELKNGLNPENASDGASYTLSDSYTNLEIYMNDLLLKR